MKKYQKLTFNNDRVLEQLEQYIIKSATGKKEHLSPVFRSEDFCLYNADCLEIMSYFPDNYLDMIFADPPYMLSNNGFTCHAGRMVSVNKGKWDASRGFDEDFKFHETWISECRRILKPEGTIWISGTLHSIFQVGYILQKHNFHILNDIAWFKPNASPNLSCTVFAHSHETLIWARKDKKAKHTFNYKFMKDGVFPEDKFKVPNKQMRSVWSIPTPNGNEKLFGKHPTQKPLNLMKRIVLSSTKENDIILDPFNGGGTTGIACQMIGKRRYIGIELEKEYIDLTTKRYIHLKNQNNLFDNN